MWDRRYKPCSVLLLGLLFSLGACNSGQPYGSSSDIQMARMDRTIEGYGSNMNRMVDNAILSDMSVSDSHFIPHTAEISGTGEKRLDRMASLLNTYGGTVRYATSLADEEMIKNRIEHVREYLALVGCDMSRTDISVMEPGGRGMPGHEATWKYRLNSGQPVEAQPVSINNITGSGQ